jgi:3-dehydroquinate synthase
VNDKLTVPLGKRSYPIIIGSWNLEALGEELAAAGFTSRVALVTNTTVAELYGREVSKSLESNGFSVTFVCLRDGEEYKNTDTVNTIYDVLIREGFDRTAGLIALGGGVVGDIAGFAAATLLRGIPYVQVPTTLLSQVDSSVGGKTGVNHPLGKNLIGAFYQPEMVFIDVDTLKTLPYREFSAGMAEVIKYGMIWDKIFFSWIKENRESLARLEPEALIFCIKRACSIKAEIVAADEREGGLRAVLNFGHTLGHAVENLSGYGEYRHGEAVAIGMLFAAKVSHHEAFCSAEQVGALEELLESFYLPTVSPPFSPADYLTAMKRDKKNREGVLRMVLNKGIGGFQIKDIHEPHVFFSHFF